MTVHLDLLRVNFICQVHRSQFNAARGNIVAKVVGATSSEGTGGSCPCRPAGVANDFDDAFIFHLTVHASEE